MSRKKKATSYKPTNFDNKNESLIKIINAFALGEGKLDSNTIKKIGNSTLFGQLKNDNLIKPLKGNKDIFIITKSFETKSCELIGKKIVFGGSGATDSHLLAVSKTAAMVPDSVLLGGNYKNGESFIQENKVYKASKSYKTDVKNIKNDLKEQLKEAERIHNETQSNPFISKSDKIAESSDFRDLSTYIKEVQKVIGLKSRNISPPDLQVKMSKDEAYEFVKNMRTWSESIENEAHKKIWDSTITKMEEKIETTTESEITYAIEYYTKNYRLANIIAKQLWAQTRKTEVFLLPV